MHLKWCHSRLCVSKIQHRYGRSCHRPPHSLCRLLEPPRRTSPLLQTTHSCPNGLKKGHQARRQWNASGSASRRNSFLCYKCTRRSRHQLRWFPKRSRQNPWERENVLQFSRTTGATGMGSIIWKLEHPPGGSCWVAGLLWQSKWSRFSRKISIVMPFTYCSEHIDQLLALGSGVCGTLTDFIFNYNDVSYGARDSASSLTDKAVIRLAEACPKLKKLQLQGADSLTETALTAFLAKCADLTSLEITTTKYTSPEFTGMALETLEIEPDRLPKLKKLILPQPSESNPKFMKAMRSLTRAWEGLTVQLVSVRETKRWGDWDLEKRSTTYKKGRKQQVFWLDTWSFSTSSMRTLCAMYIGERLRVLYVYAGYV